MSQHSADLLLVWGLIGAALGLCTLILTLRRRAVPSGLFSTLMAFTIANLLILPNSFFYTPALQMLRLVTFFFALDVLVLSIVLRRRSALDSLPPEPQH